MNLLHNKKFIIGTSVVIGLIIISTTIFIASNRKETYSTTKASRMDITEAIKASGKVVPAENVTLAFDKSGTVARVNVKVGDQVYTGQTLASLSSDDLYANLEGAQADLLSAKAKLSQSENSTGDVSTELQTAKTKLLDSVLNGYTSADDAIHNKVDQFFDDPKTMNPKIVFAFNDYDLKEKINKDRLSIEETLTAWNNLNSKIDSNSITSVDSEKARTYLMSIKNFLNEVSTAVNAFEPNNTLPQATIDKYKNDVAGARTSINTAISSLTSAEDGLRSINANKPIQEASVAKAQAAVDNIQSQINHTIISAPFGGVVTKAEPKVGEVFSAGMPAFAIITKDGFKIEIQVTEKDLAKVSLGNKAQVTLDAYGTGEVFDAHISQIDPAETTVNGVGTYKITLLFDKSDSKIYSGMNANVNIITGSSTQSLVVTQSSIITKGNDTFVLVKNKENKYEEKKVETGIIGSNGYIEIKNGLNEGDEIATFGSNK